MRQYLLTSLLKEVSRSFYLTLRLLPQPIRPQISLAYLLARISDTIADTEVLPVPARLGALCEFRETLEGKGRALLLLDFHDNQARTSDRTLMQRANEAIALLSSFEPDDTQRIRSLLEIIIGGQELDLLRFSDSSREQIKSLRHNEELDDYTYRVAGCVGEFWTRMCLANLDGSVPDTDRLIEKGIRFGKGLQMVNILRDLPVDLRNGRCYIPNDELEKINLKPTDLLLTENESRFRPLYNRYLDRAQDHLQAGWEYTVSLPTNWRRVRLACSWPILIGLATLRKLRQEPILDGNRRIKVSRKEVRGILVRSILLYPFKRKWNRLGRI